MKRKLTDSERDAQIVHMAFERSMRALDDLHTGLTEANTRQEAKRAGVSYWTAAKSQNPDFMLTDSKPFRLQSVPLKRALARRLASLKPARKSRRIQETIFHEKPNSAPAWYLTKAEPVPGHLSDVLAQGPRVVIDCRRKASSGQDLPLDLPAVEVVHLHEVKSTSR